MQIPAFLRSGRKKIIILIVLILCGGLLFNFFGRKKVASLELAVVKKQDIKSAISASGSLTGKSTASLKFKVSGKLAYINVSTGDKVSAGQTVAGLDTQDLSIALQQARNTLTDKQAIAQKAEDDVKDHSADESFAQRVTRTTAQAARDSAFDAVKAAERAFSDAVIFSPLKGTVTQAIAVPNQIVGVADLIAQIVDDSEIYFDAEVDEADIGSVSLGQEAEISLNTYPDQTFKGTVSQIMPNAKTTSGGATVIIVRILMNQTSLRIMPGLNGQASVITAKTPGVLTVPLESIKNDNTVVISQAGKLKSVPVKIGIKSDTDAEVKSGLSEGQQVVLNPPSGI